MSLYRNKEDFNLNHVRVDRTVWLSSFCKPVLTRFIAFIALAFVDILSGSGLLTRGFANNRYTKIELGQLGFQLPSPMAVTAPESMRMSYRIGRGEQGVLTFEPYKSALLPCWRFRTVRIAMESSATLWEKFLEFDAQDDFVGMDMTRKFIQMGMTRAKRYANHKGGKKYDAEGNVKEKKEHPGRAEKEEASQVFRNVWEKCKAHEGYAVKKQNFLEAQRVWNKDQQNLPRDSDTDSYLEVRRKKTRR